MASGTINGVTSNQYIAVKVEWTSVANVAANTSEVTATLYYKRTNTGYHTYGTGHFELSIGTNTAKIDKVISITSDVWAVAIRHTITVSHASNGSKSVDIYATGYIPDTTLEGSEVSGTAKLDTIPRASTLDSVSCSTAYFNGTLTFKYTPKSSSFYNLCNIAINLDGEYRALMQIKMGKKSASQQTNTATFSDTLLSTLYGYLPNSRKGVLRFTLRTYSDSDYSNEIGNGVFKEITLSIPNNSATAPSATVTITPVSSLPSAFSSLYIQGKTKVDVNFTKADGKYGADVTSYSMQVDGKTYGSPYTSEYLTSVGKKTVKSTVTNSRGMSTTYQRNITVIPYYAPKILDVVCERCDASGNLIDSGTYLKIKAKRSYSPVVSNGTQYNFCQIRYRYKVEGGSYTNWSTILASSNLNTDEVETAALLDGTLSAQSSYYVQVQAIDDIGDHSYTTISIHTERVYMHRAASINSLGIGKYAEDENMVDIADDITTKFRGEVQFAGEEWTSLGLSDGVSESSVAVGRRGDTGCSYRVLAGNKHIYVAFNCAFTYSGEMIQVNAERLPSGCRPDRDMYSMCAVECSSGDPAIAKVIITPSGKVLVGSVQLLNSNATTTSATVKWIDGYIDYWT